MKIISSITIKNFKGILGPENFVLEDPGVIIGPNNGGKTTLIQALMLRNLGVVSWYDKKQFTTLGTKPGEGTKPGVVIRNLDTSSIPINDTTNLRYKAEVRKGNKPIPIEITVDVLYDGGIYPCGMQFYRSAGQIYAKPTDSILDALKSASKETIEHTNKVYEKAFEINIGLLYPMSGISSIENVQVSGTIDTLLGQGKTGDVLRNLCWLINPIIQSPKNSEKKTPNTADRDRIKAKMKVLFAIDLQDPLVSQKSGEITVTYKPHGVTKGQTLDLISGGRGQNQILLLLCFAAKNKNSIILFDEPDAHLELLKQKQLYIVLQEIKEKRGNQIIICTHSEIMMERAGIENISFVLQGRNVLLLDESKKKVISQAIGEYGIDQYMQARIKGKVLYGEGYSDLDMIKSFAKKVHPDLYVYLTDTLYYYPTKSQRTADLGYDDALIIDVGQGEKNREKPKPYLGAIEHFKAMQGSLSDIVFTGFGFFDGDLGEEYNASGLVVKKLQLYELENYFINEYTLRDFVHKQRTIFSAINEDDIQNALQDAYRWFFDNDLDKMNEFLSYDIKPQKALFLEKSKNKKMSKFADIFFEAISTHSKKSIVIRKSEYYKIIDQSIDVGDVPKEIKDLLNEMYLFFCT